MGLVSEINPRVLRAERFNFYAWREREYNLVPRRCFNYELELFSGSGGIIIEGEYLEFKSGDVNLRRPGQVVCGVPPYSGYVICFSLCGAPPSREGYIFGSPETAEQDCQNALMQSLPVKIVTAKQDEARDLFKKTAELYARQDALSYFGENATLCQLLFLLFSEQQDTAPEPMNRKVLQAAAYVKAHFLEDFEIAGLIRESGLSKAYFHKCFRACTGTTPAGLVIKLRLERAKTLLQLTEDSVGDIAAACGYLDHVYFTHLFRKHVGLAPTKYRQSLSPDKS